MHSAGILVQHGQRLAVDMDHESYLPPQAMSRHTRLDWSFRPQKVASKPFLWPIYGYYLFIVSKLLRSDPKIELWQRLIFFDIITILPNTAQKLIQDSPMATNVSLTPELEEYVNTKVRSGDYKSVSEVVREGLRLLKEKDASQQAKLQGLREAIMVGIDSGAATPLDMNQVIAEARTKYKKK